MQGGSSRERESGHLKCWEGVHCREDNVDMLCEDTTHELRVRQQSQQRDDNLVKISVVWSFYFSLLINTDDEHKTHAWQTGTF